MDIFFAVRTGPPSATTFTAVMEGQSVMAIFGKNKNVSVVPTFTIALDKSDASYTSYGLPDDRDTCIGGLEKGANWGIETVELQNEPAKKAPTRGLEGQSIKLLSYPTRRRGTRTPARTILRRRPNPGDRHQGPAVARQLQGRDHKQDYAGCNPTPRSTRSRSTSSDCEGEDQRRALTRPSGREQVKGEKKGERARDSNRGQEIIKEITRGRSFFARDRMVNHSKKC